LKKDDLRIPSEFYDDNVHDDEIKVEVNRKSRRQKHKIVPPLNLPKDPAAELKTKIALARDLQEPDS
jgi:hypothetical protein